MKKINKTLLALFFILSFWVNVFPQEKYPFGSFKDFYTRLNSICEIDNSDLRDKYLDSLWMHLKSQNQIPFKIRDTVCFLFRGKADSVSWAGDFSSWSPNKIEFKGKKILNSDVWFCVNSFPANARLDYKIVVNGNWIADPDNPFTQHSGVGSVNSELRMPEWKFPRETVACSKINRGILSEYDSVASVHLNERVFFRVYTPFGYEKLSDLPVIYVTDGHEYADEKMGAMINVLDNLISPKRIYPVIAVFVDPRSGLDNSKNMRMKLYSINKKFADFFADEMIPLIDSKYKTDKKASARAILGTSLGGINSAYFGFYLHTKFNLIAINSPAFWFKSEILDMFTHSSKLPLKIFMSTGTINDAEKFSRQMKKICDGKGYEIKYIEVPEGHSWGNWQALIDDMLVYFWGVN